MIANIPCCGLIPFRMSASPERLSIWPSTRSPVETRMSGSAFFTSCRIRARRSSRIISPKMDVRDLDYSQAPDRRRDFRRLHGYPLRPDIFCLKIAVEGYSKSQCKGNKKGISGRDLQICQLPFQDQFAQKNHKTVYIDNCRGRNKEKGCPTMYTRYTTSAAPKLRILPFQISV